MAEERKELEENELEQAAGGIMEGTWGYGTLSDGTKISYFADSLITHDNRYSMVGKDVVIIGKGNPTFCIAHVDSTDERRELLWMTTAVFNCTVLHGYLYSNPIDIETCDVFTKFTIRS